MNVKTILLILFFSRDLSPEGHTLLPNGPDFYPESFQEAINLLYVGYPTSPEFLSAVRKEKLTQIFPVPNVLPSTRLIQLLSLACIRSSTRVGPLLQDKVVLVGNDPVFFVKI